MSSPVDCLASARPTRAPLANLTVDDALLLSVALIWGGNAVSSKYLLAVLSPSAVFCAQAVGVSLLLVGLTLLRGQRLWGTPGMGRAFLLGGLILTAQRFVWFGGLRLTNAGEAAMVAATTPIWTALMVALLGLEIIRPGNWGGIFLALAGVALVVLGAVRHAGTYAPAPLLGDAAMILSALLVAAYTVLARPWMHRFGALPFTAACNTVSAVLVLPLGTGPLLAAPWAEMTTWHFVALFYTIVLAGGYGFAIWYLAVKRTSAARANMYHYLVPVVAVLAAWLLLGERLTPWQVLGFLLTLSGVYLARPTPAARPAPLVPEEPC